MAAKHIHWGLVLRLQWALLSLLSALVMFTSNPAFAQATPEALAKTPPIEKANDIGAQPLALLAKFPEAGTAMARFVAQVITRDPQIVDAVLSIVKDTSPQQASAIGAGLVRAVRGLSAKHPALSRAIVSKISQVENLWLKTTFFALGPTYSEAALPPRQPLYRIMYNVNMSVGTGLPMDRGRVGPAIDPDPNPLRGFIAGREPDLWDKHGMLVAIMLSDAEQNGAVSTSPTQ